MANDYAKRTVSRLLEVVEVEFKIPLGIAEIKFPASDLAKRWWDSKKRQHDLEGAMLQAEQRFIAAYPDEKLAQILHDFPLYSDEEFKEVIAELLTHLDEEKITWLAEIKLEHEWNKLVSKSEIRKALELYLPFLRHELSGIEEFREIVAARSIERIEKRTNETAEGVRRIETKLDKVLASPQGSNSKDGPDFWFIPHPYPMPPNFTGRAAELKMLDNWAADEEDRLFILRALGGFGKSALAWQWVNSHVNPAEWPKLVWWSFYDGDASFEHFIEEALRYLKLEPPQGQRLQLEELLKAMRAQKILIIMDGFERALRAYSGIDAVYQDERDTKFEDSQLDCVNINAEIFLKSVCSLPNITSKVLITTRLTPRAVIRHREFLQGGREEELPAMQEEDAVEFFRRQKIKGTRVEIEATCAPYGYHPLSLRLLTGRILKDFETPGDIVVAQKLKIDGELKQHYHRVLEVAYSSLPPRERKLLSTIACFRSSIELKTLEAMAESGDPLDEDLHNLVDRGLLQFDEKNRELDLHPIVRRYAYERLTASDRKSIHLQLIDYFIDAMPLGRVQTLEELRPIIELYYHMVRVEQFDAARALFQDRLQNALNYQFGSYQTQIELLGSLFVDGEDRLPHLSLDSAKAWTLNQLAIAYALSGQPSRALLLWQLHDAICEKQDRKQALAVGLGGAASVALLPIGALEAAEHNLRRSVELAREIGREFDEAVGTQELGHVQTYCGMWNDAETELSASQRISERISHVQNQGITWAYRALRSLLIARSNRSQDLRLFGVFVQMSIGAANRALELADETTTMRYAYESDYVRAHWLLGAASEANNELQQAETHLSEALHRCRARNLINFEADILLGLARLRYDQKQSEEAKSLAEEALTITERCGYVLQGADVNLFLAQHALEAEKNKAKAKEYAEAARKLAACDGPPYYYKVAYEEAEAMLAKLK